MVGGDTPPPLAGPTFLMGLSYKDANREAFLIGLSYKDANPGHFLSHDARLCRALLSYNARFREGTADLYVQLINGGIPKVLKALDVQGT